MRAEEDYVVSLWQHEVQRTMGDRISRSTDSNWFERSIKDITKEVTTLCLLLLFLIVVVLVLVLVTNYEQ